MKIKHPYIGIAAVLLLAAALRFFQLDGISLWHDEAFSALLIKYNWREMFYRISLDVHPPVYYVFLRFWADVFGDGLFSLRAMSVFFGVGTVWATWLLTRASFASERLALVAALLVAVNPFQVEYVTEARMYTLGAFFAVFAAYSLVKALRHERASYGEEEHLVGAKHLPIADYHRKLAYRFYGLFVLSASLGDLTHYYLLFSSVALGLYGLWYQAAHYGMNLKRYRVLLLSYVLAGALFLPWLKVFLFQLKQVGEGYWIPKATLWSLPTALWQMYIGWQPDLMQQSLRIGVLVVSAVLLYCLYRFVRKTDQPERWLVVLMFVAPFGGALLFALLAQLKGSGSSVFLVRYFLYGSAFGSIAIAGAIISFRYRVVTVIATLALVLLGWYGTYRYWHEVNVPARPGMNAASRYLQANVEPGQPVVIGTSFLFFNHRYYERRYYPLPSEPLLFTGGTKHAKEISHFAGSALLNDEDLLPDFNAGRKPGDTVWVVWTHAFGSNKPDVPKAWVETNHVEYPDIRPYIGTSIHVSRYLVK